MEALLAATLLLMDYSTLQLLPLVLVLVRYMLLRSSVALTSTVTSVSAVGVAVLVYASAELSHTAQSILYNRMHVMAIMLTAMSCPCSSWYEDSADALGDVHD